MTPSRSFNPAHRTGFSLVEVLLAIFILGIGMIMVASVFPVGANWTRQTTEDSVGQTIAQNALTVLKTHYGPGGDLRVGFYNPQSPTPYLLNSVLNSAGAITPFTLQALPGFTAIPQSERAYQFGSSSPFPATNIQACTYFWTALIRLDPSHRNPLPGFAPTHFVQPSSSYKYDLYILVFRKGAAEHQFLSTSPSEIPNTRDSVLFPSVYYVGYQGGTYNASSTPPVSGAVPPVGQLGIGAISGTVFRQLVNPTFSGNPGAIARPPLIGQSQDNTGNPISGPTEPIIYSPPADGTSSSASPLIYIYQTTLTF